MSSTPNGRRLRPQRLLLPNGRTVIVSLPEDLESLRKKYANQSEIQVEIVVHGTEEHHNFLRESRDHQEVRRAALRERHGQAFDEVLEVHNELTAVTTELERLENQAVGLGENFSKFGYDAQLRTYTDDNSEPSSSRASISDGASVKSGWEDPRPGKTTKLFKRPVIKQWYHRGLLWRASEQTEIMAIELFFDLLYVGIIEINGEHVARSPTGSELLRFVITFVMSWKIWMEVIQLLSWFETDDILTRLEILYAIACLLGLTTNMTQSFSTDKDHNTYTQLVAFYLAERFHGVIHYVVTGYLLPMVRGVMFFDAILILVPAALWIASIYVDMPNRLALIFVALFLDLYGSVALVALFKYTRSHGDTTGMGRLLGRLFEFFPALNIEHRVERTNAFVSLVLGYSVVGIMFQSDGGYSINATLGKALLGLVQAFMFNWIYFDIDGNNLLTHAIRRSAQTSYVWSNAHLPFVMGYILSSAALSKLVLITDVPGTNPEHLTEEYHELATSHIPNGTRFFYCHGLAIALLSTAAISWSHEHRQPGTLRWGKNQRLANRVAACVVMFFLPLANGLTSLDLISITMALVTWVLLVELWGKSCWDDPFIGEKKGCCVRYSAKCSKRELEKAIMAEPQIGEVSELGPGMQTATAGAQP